MVQTSTRIASPDPKKIIPSIELMTGKKVTPGTLIVLDEIHECPDAIRSLRYFREERPDIPVIGAGSLLQTFRRDFGRFASRAKQPYLEKVFTSVAALVGKRIKYVSIDPDARAREVNGAAIPTKADDETVALTRETAVRSWPVLKDRGIRVWICSNPARGPDAVGRKQRGAHGSARPGSTVLSRIASLVDERRLKPAVRTNSFRQVTLVARSYCRSGIADPNGRSRARDTEGPKGSRRSRDRSEAEPAAAR